MAQPAERVIVERSEGAFVSQTLIFFVLAGPR